MTKSCFLKGNQKIFLLHLNQATSCCRAYPTSLDQHQSIEDLHQQWNEESKKLDQGVELPGCQHCWQHEKQGLQSYRQQLSHKNNKFETIELNINNTCNQMCSYCSPKFSSSWEKSITEQGVFVKISASAQKNLELNRTSFADKDWISQIYNYIDQCEDNSVVLKLLGGEPLMQLRNLERLVETNLTKIRKLQIITNLNPPNPKFLHRVLDTFPTDKLDFEISLDTVPKYNALPRAGFDQQQFEQNLNRLTQYKISFSFLSVISVLSIFTLDQYQQWLVNRGYAATFFNINNPDCFDPVYLPQQFKDKLLAKSLPKSTQEILQKHSGMVDLKQFEQYNYLKQYFSRTNTQINEPEFAEYWAWLEDKFK
jgi:organic radical activating enzyme